MSSRFARTLLISSVICLVNFISLPNTVIGSPQGMQVRGKARRPDLSKMPQITSTDPDPVRAGKTLTFYGHRFGTKKGSVTIKIGVLSASCAVKTWHDDVVIVTVPSGIETLLRGKKVPAVASVKNQIGTASKGISLVPGSGEESPRIVAMSKKVSPGDEIVIAGKHFGTDKGIVKIVSAGHMPISGRVIKWRDDWIRVQIPTTAEWREVVNAKVNIQLYRSSIYIEKEIRFEPKLATRVLLETNGFKSKLKDLSKNFKNFDNRLLNGWSVVTSKVFYTRGRHYSVRWIERPEPGATRMTCKTQVRADQNSIEAHYDIVVVIQGPAGTQPF
ncbi:MAG: hypothetical protein GY854_20070 [Deltaproteobacteria bacterium]|nr:hypothetical protein [Deltaproteobacteria bacterium]